MIFADNNTGTAVEAVCPILGRLYLPQPVELVDFFKPLIYKLPGAWAVVSYLAAVFA